MLETMETVVLYYDDPNTEYKASSFRPLLWRGRVAFTDKIGARRDSFQNSLAAIIEPATYSTRTVER